MDDSVRGDSIKRRRLALGIKSVNMFAERSGIGRVALSKAERGGGSAATMERAEAWLTRAEEGAGFEDESSPLRVTLHDVYGIREIIVEGPADRPQEIAEAIAKLIAEFRSE